MSHSFLPDGCFSADPSNGTKASWVSFEEKVSYIARAVTGTLFVGSQTTGIYDLVTRDDYRR